VDLRPILDRIHVYAFDPGTPWPLIESCLRQAINQYGCTVGYLDYFSLVGKPAGEFFSEAAKSAELSKRMRALPKSTGIIFVVLVQINREIGDAGEPSPAHIRDSGQIEQDMACGIFLWRQETKDPGKLATGLRWEYFIKIDFNRFGPGYVRIAFDFDGAHAQMTENEKTTEPAAQVSTKSGKRGKDQPLQFV
jgi:replicative DNA helicase